MTLDLAANGVVGLTRDALHGLRAVLFRDAGANAAAYLQEAGYAGGAALYQAFSQSCQARGYEMPENMTAPDFERHAAEFFAELGWGTVKVGVMHDSVITLDSADWAESDPDAAMQFPGCYLSAGLLADFFGRVGGAQLAVMEVECRSMGHAQCRFLLGSAETLQHVYDEMTKGVGYEGAVAGMA